MKKIPSLFQRNYDTDRLVRDEVVPGSEWVLAGEGTPTRKFDGVCTMIRDGKLYKRYELKDSVAASGKTPACWEACDDRDSTTGKQMGWVPVGDGPEDFFLGEAFSNLEDSFNHEDGTYEAVGVKFQGNAEGLSSNKLVRHGAHVLVAVPRDYDGIKNYLKEASFEGIVWHHPDGRMVKIKRKDFFKKGN